MRLSSVFFHVGLTAVMAFVLAVAALSIYRIAAQHRVRMETNVETEGIDSLERVMLDGVPQWILLRGRDVGNPVLLILHGGPGAADISFARKFDGELVADFIVVHWDQRGTGKSYNANIPVQSMNRAQFVSDVRELTELLRARFSRKKIFLLGHSWGSEIGMLAASQYPNLFHAFIGVGQVVKKSEQEEISYRFALQRATATNNRAAIRALRETGPPPYKDVAEQSVQRRWLERLGGIYHGRPFTYLDFARIAFTSPDYDLADVLNLVRGPSFSEPLLWNERLRTDLFTEVPRIEVPVFFFAGRSDYNTPFELVQRYYEAIEAPKGKSLIWFERAGHMIPYESPGEFHAALVQVKKEVLGR